MNVTRDRVLVAVGAAVVAVVGLVLFGVVKDLSADPVVVEGTEAGAAEGEGEAPAEAAASVSE